MSEVTQQPSWRAVERPVPAVGSARPMVVIGTGNVGGELLDLLQSRTLNGLSLVGLANSRTMLWDAAGLCLEGIQAQLAEAGQRSNLAVLETRLLEQAQAGVVVDLTASPDVADRHAGWVRAGLSVVTANKWAAAGDPRIYHELIGAQGRGLAHYRHATTVGAGLPLLDSLQRLRSAGESILNVSGLFPAP